jgi:hypothetical protein
MERAQQFPRINNRFRPNSVMVRRDVQLPAIELERLTLVNAARNPAMLLDPVRNEEAQRVQRVEFERQILVGHITQRPLSGSGTTSAQPPRRQFAPPTHRPR